MQVQTIPLLRDNYAYLLLDKEAGTAVVIDPSEPGPIIQELDLQGLRLIEIWCTHHHLDHTGGVAELVHRYGPRHVVGSTYDMKHDRIPYQNVGVTEETGWRYGDEEVGVLSLPGHTLGALGYVISEALFSGDVLFVAGCGYVFEGTMAQMWSSLEKLRKLKPSIQLYCGHEYALDNLSFAQTVEPNNHAIGAKILSVKAALTEGMHSVPSPMGTEFDVNPFLRWDQPEVIAFAARQALSANASSPISVFSAIREAKNQFRAPPRLG